MRLEKPVTYKTFCSTTVDGGNCGNEAIGEVGYVVGNNPLPGKEIMYLPVCQIHLDALDNPEGV